MADSVPQLRRCTLVTQDDLRALSEFLRSPNKTEGQLHRILETHTGILGGLGYDQFFSEYAVHKRDETDVIRDARRRDRIDILAVRESPVVNEHIVPYLSPDVIELKWAHEKLLNRFDGLRPSDAMRNAIDQLSNYVEWLTTVQENRDALQRFGVSVLRPGKHLIIGSEAEFADRAGLLQALREECVQRYGFHLWLIEDVLKQADRMRLAQYGSIEGVVSLKAPFVDASPLILASSGLAGLVMLGRNLLDKKRSVYGNIVMNDGPYEGLVHIKGKRLQPLARAWQIPFAEAVIDFSQYRKQWKPVTNGIVVALPDAAAMERAIYERELRNTEEVRERRRQARKRREAEFTREFARRIRARYPNLPADDEFRIATRATEVGSGRVGRSKLASDPIFLAVAAHARWNYTEYPARLEEVHEEYRLMECFERRYLPPPANVAQRAVYHEVQALLDEWSKPQQIDSGTELA